jgi:hypothetical protein
MYAFKSFPGIIICFIGFLMSFAAEAQYYKGNREIEDVKYQPEITIALGGTNFLGDLGGRPGEGKPFVKDFLFQTIRPYVGVSVSWNPENWYSLTAGAGYTVVDGADSLITMRGGQERWRVYRNNSFRSRIFELSAMGELRLLPLLDPAHEMHRITPYVGLGIGLFHFNPQATLNGQWIDLHPLHLEGQGFPEYPDRKEYKLTQIYIPISLGVKYYTKNRMGISVGALFRKTFTDYIDDVSTTYIDPKLFDKYLSPDAAILARQLYSRSLRPEKVKPNVGKGEPSNKDNYVSMVCALSFFLKRHPAVHYPGRPRYERW